MLSNAPVYAAIPVKDMVNARKFYEEKLGLSPSEDNQGGVSYSCGNGTAIFVYESEFAGTNKGTAASWSVDNVEATVKELKDKGVAFEEYDNELIKTVDGVATWDDEKAAWFKDPDGNILGVNSM